MTLCRPASSCLTVVFLLHWTLDANSAENNALKTFSFRVKGLADVRGNETTWAAVERAQNASVAVVFIPGFLGSKLTRSGEEIWGKNRVDATTLALKPSDPDKPDPAHQTDPSVTPELLYNYSAYVKKNDAYRTFWLSLKNDICNGRATCIEFPYDWRLDVRLVAKQLNGFLHNVKEKHGPGATKVILVAHSWGSVVAWAWQSGDYEGANPSDVADINVQELVLAGPPLSGVCEMARMLQYGYQPSPEDDGFATLFYKILFGEGLRAAAFTFPAIFEHLPLEDASNPAKSCVITDVNRVTSQWQPFSIDFWKPRDALGFRILNGAWDKLNWNQDQFFRNLEAVLTTARDFRSGFEGTKESPGYLYKVRVPVKFYYSVLHDTVSGAKFTYRDGRWDDGSFQTQGHGDGRVLGTVARNDGFGQCPEAGCQPFFQTLSESHGDLPKDVVFLATVTNDISRTADAVRAEAMSIVLASDSELRDAFVRVYGSRGGTGLSSTSLAAQLGHPVPALDAVNESVLRATLPSVDKDLTDFLAKGASSFPRSLITLYSSGSPYVSEELIPFLELSAAGQAQRAGLTPKIRLLLGDLLAQQGDSDGAALAYKEAADQGDAAAKQKAGEGLVRLGEALLASNPAKARQALQGAVDRGNLPPDAQHRVEQLLVGLALAEKELLLVWEEGRGPVVF